MYLPKYNWHYIDIKNTLTFFESKDCQSVDDSTLIVTFFWDDFVICYFCYSTGNEDWVNPTRSLQIALPRLGDCLRKTHEIFELIHDRWDIPRMIMISVALSVSSKNEISTDPDLTDKSSAPENTGGR